MPVSCLPEDPPPIPALEVKGVKEGDYRKGLIPKQDLAVETRAALANGTVLGLCRNLTPKFLYNPKTVPFARAALTREDTH